MKKRRRITKKAVALILSVLLVMQSINLYAFAAETEESVITSNGFTIHVSWDDTEFKSENQYNLEEDTDISNAVKLRISYANEQVSETGYSAGELIITVKGIGNVGRDKVIEAVVGADKETEGTKNRDWSYTWNKASDTYIFTNNNEIKPNSVLSGYFDLVWDIASRESKEGYSQSNIQAELLLPDGSSAYSEVLSFHNDTTCDTYQVDIELKDIYSYEGLTDGITNPDDYAYYKYILNTVEFENSRGLENYRFIFDPDANDLGSGAKVIKSDVTAVSPIWDGTWQISLPLDTTNYTERYIYVAYPLDSYGGKDVTAELSLRGIYHEGDDSGVITEARLASDSVQWTIPNDFQFTDIPGYIYSYYKDTWYDRYVDPEDTLEKGGDISGRKLVKGTTETFYLEGSFNKPSGATSTYSFEMVDDFLYILKNNGDYRQLQPEEYDFSSVTIPGVQSLKNINGVALEEDIYTAKVYAFSDGSKADITNASPVYSGLIGTTSKKIELDEGTSAVAVVLGGFDVSVCEFTIPVEVDFHINDTSDFEWALQDNLTSGKVENTTFVKMYQGDVWANNVFTADNYVDDTNLQLAAKDLTIYGSYLDREKDSISLYAADKSDYDAYTKVDSIEASGKLYTTEVTIGADFAFSEEEALDQFSLYTVLPEDLAIIGYDIPEDIWDIFTFEGMGLDEVTLAEHALVDIIENYMDSGCTYVGVHFDLSDLEIASKESVRVSFPVKLTDTFFDNNRSSILIRSAVLIDKEIYEYTIDKVTDNGAWDSNAAISKDIDRDDNSEENLAYDSDWASYVYADSSELQISKAVKTTNIKDYVQLPDIPMAELGSEYIYELSIANGASISKNIVVKDLLETGSNSQWKGTFASIDISDAEEKGLTGTVWYSSKANPGEVGGSDWESSMLAEKVKAIAVDFGSCELGEGEEIRIYLHMTAPNDSSLVNKVTENGFSASFTMLDVATGNETASDTLDSNLVQVKITSKLKNIIVNKIDATSGEALEGASFALINKDTGEVVAEGISNARGKVVFKRVPSDVTYIIRETAAPVGYNIADDVEAFFGDEDSLSISIANARKTGTVAVFKTNSLDNLIYVMGAEYGLYTEDGSEISTAITDINGKAEFTGIEWGKYYIQEKTAPAGYSLDENQYPFELTKENADTLIKFNIKDDQSGDTSVHLKKYEMTVSGVQTDIPLKGVAFKLVNVTGGRETVMGTYVTDANGEIYVEDLPYGDYKFIETRIPDGFEKVDDVTFTISPSSMNAALIVYNQRESGTITVYKTDTAGNTVEGAVFELYDAAQANVLGTYATNDAGNIIIEGLEWGTYYLHEKAAPACYILSDEWYEAVVTRTEKNAYINAVNETKKGTVILTKTDEIGTVRLEGAVFNLYSGDGSLLQEGLVTDENGEIKVEELEWGSYYFKETAAPVGYSLTDETVRFAVNSLNAGVEQSIMVSNPTDSKMLTITKEIVAKDINFDNGDPTFMFKVEGVDVNGNSHTYYRIIRFDENYVAANTDAGGLVSQSTTVSGLIAGEYVITEEDSSRYAVDYVYSADDNVAVNGVWAAADLTSEDSGSVTFSNDKYESGDFSHNQSAANVLKETVKLTALKVEWLGDTLVEAKSSIDRDLVRATAIYDDGSVRVLASDEWFFDTGFKGTTFPNINGEYVIPVCYVENGITKGGSFSVTIYGAVTEVIALEASVMSEYATVVPQAALDTSMFNATAIYSDGSRVVLSTGAEIYTTITSPNYPDSYPSSMTEDKYYWEASYDAASYLKVVFSDDSETESASYDWISLYDQDGTQVEKLGGSDFAGQEYIIDGSYVKIAMKSDGSIQETGFSANVYPLDSAQNVIVSASEITIDKVNAPASEGIFTVRISLASSFEDYTEGIYADVNITSAYPEPILAEGNTFRTLVPSDATKIVFTDIEAPEGASLIDVSAAQDMSVVGWLEDATFKVSTQRSGNKAIANPSGDKMFYYLKNISEIDVNYLDTSRVESMISMFNKTGASADSLTIEGLDSWNTSNVETMKCMFYGVGSSVEELSLGDLSSWDVSSVDDFSQMFYSAGEVASSFNIGDIGCWDVSGASNFSGMFKWTAYKKATTFYVGDLGKWDTSSAEDMSEMFYYTGQYVTDFDLGDLSKWNTSKVGNMHGMFERSGSYSESWHVGDLSTKTVTKADGTAYTAWDVSSVGDMGRMFYHTAIDVSEFDIGDIGNWETSSVTDMSFMFEYFGEDAETWDIGDLSTKTITRADGSKYTAWDVSSVTLMTNMFTCAAKNASEFNIGNIGTWNVASVTSMFGMFRESGANEAETWYIGDLSGWNVSSVTDMNYMFDNAGKSKAQEFNIGNIGNWDMSSVGSVTEMFYFAGYNADTWYIGDLSNWNTSGITSMNGMFSYAAKYTTDFNIGDLSTKTVTRADGSTYTAWDVSSVTDMKGMFEDAGYNSETVNLGNLGNWNVSSVTDMTNMFSHSGYKSDSWYVGDLSGWDTSGVSSMMNMFYNTAYNADSFNIGNISTWNVSSVTDMTRMFQKAGYSASYLLDLSGWSVPLVTSYNNFNYGVESKVVAPTWVN